MNRERGGHAVNRGAGSDASGSRIAANSGRTVQAANPEWTTRAANSGGVA
jgi:hypothetical protein